MFGNDKHMISPDDVAFGKEAIRETMARLARVGKQLDWQTVPRGAIDWIIAESANMYDHNLAWSIMESARQAMVAEGQLDAPIFSSETWHMLKPDALRAACKRGS